MEDIDSKKTEVSALYVHPDFQKLGEGSLLINKICENKKREGI